MAKRKNNKTTTPFSKNKGWRILGIGPQECVKYFFGGNAMVSIIVLILICFFLAKEAVLFFPDYKANLELYRKSGQEFVDFADDQLEYQKRIKSLTTQVKSYELYERAGKDAEIPGVFNDMKRIANSLMKDEMKEVGIASDRLEKEMWTLLFPDDQETQDKMKSAAVESLKKAQTVLNERVVEVAPLIVESDLKKEYQGVLEEGIYPNLQQALVEYYTDFDGKDVSPSYVKTKVEEGEAKRSELLENELFKEYAAVEASNNEGLREFENLVNELRTHALVTKQRAESFKTAAARRVALEEGMKHAGPERKRSMEVEFQRIPTEAPDFTKLNQRLYAALPEHQEKLDAMMTHAKAGFSKLPDGSELSNKKSIRLNKELHENIEDYDQFMAQKTERMHSWAHDKKLAAGKSFFGFFFGKKWVTNSSWNDFYGLMPLFGGSLGITLIAIAVALPFSIGGAIYVNRVASPTEQNLVKPIIEFIQAIPSIVLAFFGVVVLGKYLVDWSNLAIFSWLPGFPMDQGLNMLNAGVLLGFMAIPTMFTLAEDALNNVPKSYTEASLALGASKLKTIFRVVVPCAISGIIAAILLGFGRIIGETMVVLLVAGGRIALPETWTDPVHTMTGIIAQETGEVTAGSIHYRALFMVGLVLFTISLLLNSLAQKIVKKFGHK
ncbi:phosphate ABC transporter permease subunit PstC [Verrucomicrobiaceae bacterium 5K15]|uniref:Phosphate transport system permease protein n=1 Tax=Oceaniferula flava TaxID=2800421 RepID=A0AAE2VAQ1_9BACT|nr:phosphate ABC transporter permease subunit PstC [Oceaniferula flavus]MBK1853575.1 phosphate ABC transporter permease subunit PstC [Oceaniferula flavus]MBM1134880.1 phosphate ABC transporter permease subunit PstC [Oceaniferula flavus]